MRGHHLPGRQAIAVPLVAYVVRPSLPLPTRDWIRETALMLKRVATTAHLFVSKLTFRW
jgi:hypothetical protein